MHGLIAPLLRAAVASLFLAVSTVVARANDPPPDFVTLFNGKDLAGWCGREHVDPQAFRQLPTQERAIKQNLADAELRNHWRVEKRELINDGGGVFCTTENEYENFELCLEWLMSESGTDSGIYLRGCPQVQIWDPDNPRQKKHGAHLGSGGLWNNSVGSPGRDPLARADRPIGEWNVMRIRMVDDRVTVYLNGSLVVDDAVMHNYWNRKAKLYSRGPIQLQTHGGEMRFRNIFIRDIDEKHIRPVGSFRGE